MSMTFREVLADIRKNASNERRKGEFFEHLIQRWLRAGYTERHRIQEVWMWNEFPYREQLGGQDLGIDLVIHTTEGEYWSVQCKCYVEESTIEKRAVDSFISNSNRIFKDQDNQECSFSHLLWVSTSANWGKNAEETLIGQKNKVSVISQEVLENSGVDWEKLYRGKGSPEQARIQPKELRHYQLDALNAVHEHFQTADRGKLIMACGTGKTLTALRIAENETQGKGLVLFLVPSIALIQQTLISWSDNALSTLQPIVICSDAGAVRRKKNNDDNVFNEAELASPACTSVPVITERLTKALQVSDQMVVVFSTYQSIQVISEAQKAYQQKTGKEAVFDLIICDEAHRTTGVTLKDEEESNFVRVHDNDFIQAKRRLYMTATPRLYSAESQRQAAEHEVYLCSMDDESLYGKEIYRLGFGKAVEKGCLSDYRVLILTMNEAEVPAEVQTMLANEEDEIKVEDTCKLLGCFSALSKRMTGENKKLLDELDPGLMHSAVAFCQSIKVSKAIMKVFNKLEDEYYSRLPNEIRKDLVAVHADHVNGSMSAGERARLLNWLEKGASEEQSQEENLTRPGACRILTNVRCLSEGVDVPSLDAILFLSPRSSQVDVVQAVGRVMRKAEGKKYGYIIIPVVIPSGQTAETALDKNTAFAVVWQVLNALRAHDDRFDITVNSVNVDGRKPDNILIDTVHVPGGEGGDDIARAAEENEQEKEALQKVQSVLSNQFETLQNTFYAKLVNKVGDKHYWEEWAKDVAEIAQRHIAQIKDAVSKEGPHKAQFQKFMDGLHKNINTSITEDEAIEMLAQHLITRPVFEALFGNDPFVQHKSVSEAMQKMVDTIENQPIKKEKSLEEFYESVRRRVSGIQTTAGKQKTVLELYESFFKTAFPMTVAKLGIVYTPVECVDFIVHSVEDVLKKEFGRSLTDKNVHILDPFTGTGTFIVRLLQSDIIKQSDLDRKYAEELHANEIVLLAYYIAATNIAYSYKDRTMHSAPFDGICLTDTFQLGETEEDLVTDSFPYNSRQIEKQKKKPIMVIMGNPPYSKGQENANDNAQNLDYPKLDERIKKTYAEEGNVNNQNALYDSYIRAFRWASDRIAANPNGGVIGFISNGAWLDGIGHDGFRKCLENEFSSIYVFNLRGNCRTQGEVRKKEGDGIFGQGSRTPISITILVKKPGSQENAKIFYHDIGDYLSREEKLKIIKDFESIRSEKMEWTAIHPNEKNDWINQRGDVFDTLLPLDPEKKFDEKTRSFFVTYSLGVATGRDAWTYNYSYSKLQNNVNLMAVNYNNEVDRLLQLGGNVENIDDFVDNNPQHISWNRNLKKLLIESKKISINKKCFYKSIYRPYSIQYLYFEKDYIAMLYRNISLFPTSQHKNFVICVSGKGNAKRFTCMISNTIVDLNSLSAGAQCFPLYWYEENAENADILGLFASDSKEKYVRKDGVSDWIWEEARKRYGAKVTKEDIFYYVYGLLHSPQYREQFANELKKSLPKIPLVEKAEDFKTFSDAGRDLAELHLNYETGSPCPGVTVDGDRVIDDEYRFYSVNKMRFPAKGQKETIIYNDHITIRNIPAEAYEYVVNGRSAVEWVMENYQDYTDKDSQIRNDPNDWSREHGKPRYILDLLLSVINLSVKTMKIVKSLPELTFPEAEEAEQ